MQYLPNGVMLFDDIYEMYYNLFLELNLGVDQNGYLYDIDTGITLKYKDKYIKAAMTRTPVYPGAYDIVFDPSQNYNLMVVLLGYYLDKEASNENKIGYIAQYIDENEDSNDRMQRVVVKTRNGEIFSHFYHNIFLAYIDIVFILSGNTCLDLSNFDIII
mgnify:CR=1 FL=1